MSKISVTKIGHLSGHKGAIYTLEKAGNDSGFYSGGDEGYVAYWNTQVSNDGKLVLNVPRPVYSICYDGKRRQMYCGSAAGNLHVTDLDSGKEIRNIEAHALGIYDIKKTADALYTAGGDGKVCKWDINTFQLSAVQQLSDKSARVIAIHPYQPIVAVGYSDYCIRLFDSETLVCLHTIEAHQNSVFALSFDHLGNYLLSGGRDALLRRWDTTTNYKQTHDIPAHTLHIKHIAFNESGRLFATVSMDKTIKIWDAESMTLLKVIDKARNDAHINSVNKVIWLDENQFVTCSDDKQIMIWEIAVV